MLLRLTRLLIDEWAAPREQKFLRIIMAEGLRGGVSATIHPRGVVERAQRLLAGLFTEMIRLKLIRPADPRVLAREFMGPMLMLRMTHLVLSGGAPDLKKLKALAEAHVEFFWRAVRP